MNPSSVSRPLSRGGSSREDDDSEWEYEYHETETEVGTAMGAQVPSAYSRQDFYVTIDCSSTSHHTREYKKPEGPNKPASPPVDPDGHNEAGDRDDPNDTALEDETLPLDPSLLDKGSPQANEEDDTDIQEPVDPLDRIQILDLHTANPLISYKSQIYSCTWGSTIGTDLFFAPASSLPPRLTTPLQSNDDVAILPTSCIKLTARPATVVPRTDALSSSQAKDTKASTIQVEGSAPIQKRKQASFLESLIAIKKARGEEDEVTVNAIKANQGTGWRVRQRKRWERDEEQMVAQSGMELDDGDGDIEDEMGGVGALDNTRVESPAGPTNSQQGPAKTPVTTSRAGRTRTTRTGRPRGSRRARKARAMGGLFRDYVPEVGDEVGADIMAADRTPQRWGDVGRRASEATEDGSSVQNAEEENAGAGAEEGGLEAGEEDVAVEGVE